MQFFKKKYHIVILVILLLVGFIFAFYEYPYRYNFEDETLREAIIGIEGARLMQAPLTGGFSSAGPFTWGPWFYYQMILISLVFPTFYAPWIYLGIIYIAGIALLYKIGEYLDGKDFGLILTFLGTFSPALIIGTTHLTFPNAITFFALFSVFLFIKIIKKTISAWWTFLFGLVMGIGINVHYQMAILLILPLMMFLYKKNKIHQILYFSGGLLITFIPLILFDLTNHWFNLRNIAYYYLHGKDAIYVPNRWLFYVRDFWPGLWADVIGVSNLMGFFMMIGVALVLTYNFFKRKISTPIILLTIAFLIDFIILRYYWGERFFGYFNSLRPFIFIFTGYILLFVYKFEKLGRYIFAILILGLVFIILPKSVDRFKLDPLTKTMYQQVALLESEYPDKKFSVYNCEGLYKGNEHSFPKSVIFLLSKDGRVDQNGYKIGLEKGFCLQRASESAKIDAKDSIVADQNEYPRIPNTDIYDFSKADEQALIRAGWAQISLRSIYDSNTRWWFNERP